MKRLLLSVSLFAMLTWSPAHGQLATFDAANAVGQVKSLLQDLKGYALQAQQYTAEAQSAVQLATTAASLIQHPNLGQALGLMNMAGINNPLGPVNPYAIMGLTSGIQGGGGIQGLVGKFSMLGSLVNTSYSTDHLYTCTNSSYSCQQQQQLAYGNAGVKGLIGQLYTDLNNHIPVLNGLRAQLATSTDPAQRENIIAQLGVEQAWAQNATAQGNIALALAQAQQQTNMNRENEYTSQSVSAILASAPK